MLTSLLRIPDVLEHEVITNALNGNAQRAREEEVSKNPRLIHRLGAKTLGRLARASPSVWDAILLEPYRTRGYEVIGAGTTSVVLLRDGRVIKLARPTLDWDVRCFERRILPNIETHPTVAAATDIVGDYIHPRSGKPCVALLQSDYRHHTPIEDLETLGDAAPLIRSFAERSLDEMAPNGVAPDVCGTGNMLYHPDSGITLVDTITVTSQNRPSFKTNIDRLIAYAHASADTTSANMRAYQQNTPS